MIQVETSRAKRLKSASHGVHEGLDKAIMAAQPFSSRETYAEFLRIQQTFHRDIAALYALPLTFWLSNTTLSPTAISRKGYFLLRVLTGTGTSVSIFILLTPF